MNYHLIFVFLQIFDGGSTKISLRIKSTSGRGKGNEKADGIISTGTSDCMHIKQMEVYLLYPNTHRKMAMLKQCGIYQIPTVGILTLVCIVKCFEFLDTSDEIC